MTDIYTQENGSKKKFLAPVLVILLSMVSLTAAGYAYSATVSVDDNPGPEADWIMIDLNGTDPIVRPDTTSVGLSDHIAYKYNTDHYDKYNTVKYEVIEGVIAQFNLKITGTVESDEVVVSSADLTGDGKTLDTQVGVLKLGQMIGFKIGTSDNVAEAVAFNEAGTPLTVDYDPAVADSGEFTVYVFLVAGSDATGIVQAEKLVASDDDYAEAYYDLIKAAPAFTLSFEAVAA